MLKITRDRIWGVYLGIAIGDALGRPVENFSPEKIVRLHGRITTYVPPIDNKWFKDDKTGVWTDDYHLTDVVANSLIRCKRIDLDDMAKAHVKAWQEEGDLGFGGTTRNAIRNLSEGIHWSMSGRSKNPDHGWGNAMPMKLAPMGALMASPAFTRLYPEPITREAMFYIDVTHLVLMTHYTKMAIESALAHINAVRYCLQADRNNFSAQDFISAVVESTKFASDLNRPSHPNDKDNLPEALKSLSSLDLANMTVEQISAMFGQGKGYVYHTLPFCYALFLRNPFGLEAFYNAINAGGDTDTNASIVGGLLGALHGSSIFPYRLIRDLWQVERVIATADKFYDVFFKGEAECS